MTLIWPTELPRPTRDGYQRGWTDPRLERETDAPIPSYRLGYSSVAHPVKLTLVLERWQKAVFDNFYADATGFGTTPFKMPDPVTDGWELLTPQGEALLTPGGDTLLLSKSWICLFGKETPSERLRGVSFTVGFSVWVMP